VHPDTSITNPASRRRGFPGYCYRAGRQQAEQTPMPLASERHQQKDENGRVWDFNQELA